MSNAIHSSRAAARAAKRSRRREETHGRARRSQPVWTLPGASEFSEDRVLSDPIAVVMLFKKHCPHICEELVRATTKERDPGVAGRNRLEGSWALLFLAHLITGNPDWQRFYDTHCTDGTWAACDFGGWVPSLPTLYLRFCELEQPRYVAAFTAAANALIQIAAGNEPRAFKNFHIDGTAMHTHALLEHKCPSQQHCDRMTEHYGPKPAKLLARANDDAVNSERHESSAQPEPENPDLPPANKLTKLSEDQALRYGLRDWETCRYFVLNGHVLRCRDKDVGARMYAAQAGKKKKKFWVGGYFLPAVEHFFKAPTAVHFFEADIQEHLGAPELHRKLLIALGKDQNGRQRRPSAFIADKAWNNKTFIGHNTHNGISTITPERGLPGGKDVTSLRGDNYDEHGPRCKHCGGPCNPVHLGGKNVGFVVTNAGDPRIRYRCVLGWFDECAKPQAMSCKHELRALLPTSRRDPVFHDLLATHKTYEGVFDSWRDRYAVSGTHHAKRSKRRASIAAQKLRAAGALLAEWFRICMRHGYVGNHKLLNTAEPEVNERGETGLTKVKLHRRKHGLDVPLGAVAEARGIVGETPESILWKLPDGADPDEPPF